MLVDLCSKETAAQTLLAHVAPAKGNLGSQVLRENRDVLWTAPSRELGGNCIRRDDLLPSLHPALVDTVSGTAVFLFGSILL